MAYVRALSKDVEIHDESKVYRGYTLYAPMYEKIAWLVDMKGQVVNYWEMTNPPGVHGKLLPNGNLMWLGRGAGAIEELGGGATELVEVDWEGNEVWRYDDPFLHHDFVCLENGNVIVLRFVDIPAEIQKNIKGGVPGTELDGKIFGVSVAEVTRKGEIIWEWKSHEHFDIDRDVECPLANRMVWGYTNSVDVFPNGDILLSIRHFNTVARVERKTGDIIWRWGPAQLLGHQHCARVLDNGKVLIFDNGLHRIPFKPGDPYEISSFEASRAVEVDPKTDEIVWEYIDPLHLIYTNFCGSAQRLPNGNTLLCESRTGTIYEVTYDKEIVWKYASPIVVHRPSIWGWSESKLIFQAHRYGEEFEGFRGKDLDPERFEWAIRRKSDKIIDMEARIRSRLSRAGY
ncbi:MAG TPA: aryl-sulfate sulfotransferase [Spirochaetia bacterium]|nr:aryl-sulfate sulfotransferase [Spirochaetia bacterium]